MSELAPPYEPDDAVKAPEFVLVDPVAQELSPHLAPPTSASAPVEAPESPVSEVEVLPAVDLNERPPWLSEEDEQDLHALELAPVRRSLPKKESLYCIAAEASLTEEPGRRLTTDAAAEDPLSLNRLLGHYGQLAKITHGACAWAELTMRPDPTFGIVQDATLDAERAAARNPQKTTFDRLGWNLHKSTGGEDTGIVETKRKKEIQTKTEQIFHATGVLRVMIWGHIADADQIDLALQNITEDGFAFYGTRDQHLVWKRCDPRLLTAHAWDEYQANLRGLTLKDIAVYARAADKYVTAPDVVVARSTLRPLYPDHVYPRVPDNPAKIPHGLIPLGICKKGSEDERIYSVTDASFSTGQLIFGTSGSGKSKFLEGEITSLINADRAMVSIDPHNTVAESVLRNAPLAIKHSLLNSIVYLDLSDTEHPLGYNPLDIDTPDEIPEAVSSVLTMAVTHLDIDGGAPRTVRLLKMALIALCEANLEITDPDEKLGLLQIAPFFTDEELRDYVMGFNTNTDVFNLYGQDQDWDNLKDADKEERSRVLVLRFSDFSTDPHIKLLLSSSRNRFKPAELVAQNKKLLIGLGINNKVPENFAYFIAGLILYELHTKRDKFGYKFDRKTGKLISGTGCVVVLDEAAHIVPKDDIVLKAIAEQHRKLGFILIACSQAPSQWGPLLQPLINNLGILVSFRLDAKEAMGLMSGLNKGSMLLDALSIASLNSQEFYIRVKYKIAGDHKEYFSAPFALSSLPMVDDWHKDLIPGGLTSEHEEWIDTRIDEIVRRSQKLLCNSSAEMLARLDGREVPAQGFKRLNMTFTCISQMHKDLKRYKAALKAKEPVESLNLLEGGVAPFKTAATIQDREQVAAVEAMVAAEDSEYLVPDPDQQETFVEWT